MKFEYITKSYKPTGFFLGGKVDDKEFNNILNELAKDNWLLDKVIPVASGYGTTSKILLIFKRPLS